ncbi:MAG: twin-arginine translocation signal domain-containing protein [Desulfobacteraceae bacterium]|nr:twin-arginine translocation signal domain-containing protein [Desulfobacteraceae bacterium]
MNVNRRTFLKMLGAGAAAPVLGKIDLVEAFLIPKNLDLDKVLLSLYQASTVCGISHTDFEGSIKSLGDTVIIQSIPEITVMPYTPGQPMQYARPVAKNETLNIDQTKTFALKGGLKDKNLASDYVGMELARVVDRNVFTKLLQYAPESNKGNSAGNYSASLRLGTGKRPVVINKNNVIDAIIDMGTTMDETNVPRNGKRWAVLHSNLLKFIHTADIKAANVSAKCRNGMVGIIDDITLYKSDDIPSISTAAGTVYCVPFGHKDAFAFACNVKGRRLLYGEKALKKEGLGVYCARASLK